MSLPPSALRPPPSPASPPPSAAPRRELSLFDSTCIIVGIIIAAGIYRSSPDIARQAPSVAWLMGLWLFGGLLSLIGALCYAELATAYPKEGGDYVYLTRALGRRVGFLFAWCQLWIVRPGSIGAMAYVFAEYANQIWPQVTYRDLIGPIHLAYAGGAIVVLTVVNLLGVREGKWTQNVLTTAKVLGLAAIVAVGFTHTAPSTAAIAPAKPLDFGLSEFGLAMIFVLFTYGGWNEMAYVAAEVKEPRKNILRALLVGTLAVTAIYVVVNLAFIHALGLEGTRNASVAADVLRLGIGPLGRPGDQPFDLHLRPGGHQRPNLHRVENLLRDGPRASALRLAGPLECPARHARLLVIDPRARSPWRWRCGSA